MLAGVLVCMSLKRAKLVRKGFQGLYGGAVVKIILGVPQHAVLFGRFTSVPDVTLPTISVPIFGLHKVRASNGEPFAVVFVQRQI